MLSIYQKANISRMKLLISNAQVCDLQSSFHGKTCDILLHDGKVEQIRLSTKKAFVSIKGLKTIDAKGQLAMPGLVDLRADFCDPGFEHKETLNSGAAAAMAGGFTDVALLPSTNPSRDTKIGIEYVLNQAAKLPIYLHPYGALSANREGKEMAELFDMKSAGAVGFTDGNRAVASAGLLMRVLLYSKIFDGLTLVLPNDASLSGAGLMHEGVQSTLLGLKGIPAIAEETIVHRDIEILKYTGGRIHFSALSSKGSVDLVRKAKKAGLQVSADVAFANLCFTEEQLADYDSNFKLFPPVRGKADQKALWEGVQDGTIDAIVSNHQPQNKESKEVEFEYALPGMISLQILLPILVQTKPSYVEIPNLIAALSRGPRKVLNIEPVQIEEGAKASICLFHPSKAWTFDTNFSKSENSPFLHQKITGKVSAVVCKDAIYQL